MQKENRGLFWSSLVFLAGLILSGPVALVIVRAVAPQPPWRNLATFTEHYQPIQNLPYWLGLALVGGAVWFAACAAARMPSRRRVSSALALILSAAFAAMIAINYTVQLAFVPAALGSRSGLAAELTMSNPRSLGWALEMVGYGLLGVATWLLAPAFPGGGRNRWIRGFLVVNGVMSVVGALATFVDLAWVMTPAGFAAYLTWNLVVAVAMALVALEARSTAILRSKEASTPTPSPPSRTKPAIGPMISAGVNDTPART
jgi:hypothetical protein